MPNELQVSDRQLAALARRFGTPLYVYDARTIRARIAELRAPGVFDVLRYAQKANPNLAVLQLVRREGCRVDAVSAGEIERALAAGYAPDEIAFTADLFDRPVLTHIAASPIEVNCGSSDMFDELARVRPRARVTLRINPGFGHGHHRKVTTGGEESKHGIWHAELSASVARARALGLEVVGLHLHIGSGASTDELERAASAMEVAARAVGPALEAISAGGGLPVPYRAGEARFDVARHARVWGATRERIARSLGRAVRMELEPGRFLVAESGVLIAEVLGTKRQGALEYVLIDAGFHTLLRPALYGAYHEIRALEKSGATRPTIVAGPLCESADVFTQRDGGELEPRALPELVRGDLVAIDTAGAYGFAMSSNYNSQPFAAEVLVDRDLARLVRRRQTVFELFASELDLEDEQ